MTQSFRLPSGAKCELLAPEMPGVPNYHVLAAEGPGDAEDVEELARLAIHLAQALGTRLFGDPGAFSVIVNGNRASRRPWAHAHIVPVETPRAKRRAFACLSLKGPLRRLRHPALRPAKVA